MNSGQLNLLRTFFLISGILNGISGVVWAAYTIIGGIAFCGLGCVLGFLPVINIIACVMDFIAFNRLSALNRSGTYSTVKFAAIFDIISILTGNLVSMIFGIISLTTLSNEDLKNEMRQRGIF